MFFFSNLATALSLVLCLLTMQRMLQGLWRRYLLLFAYICGVVIFLLSFWVFQFKLATPTPETIGYYQTVLLLTQGLSMAAAVSLYFRFAEQYAGSRKEALGLGLVAIVGVAVVATLEFVSSDWSTSRGGVEYASRLSRDFSFLSALLTLVLWMRILPAWRKDKQLLAFAAGLGLSCSGDALSIALRLLEVEWLDLLGRVISYLLAILAPYLWSEAAKMKPKTAPVPMTPSTAA